MSADKTSNISCCPRSPSGLLNTNSISPFFTSSPTSCERFGRAWRELYKMQAFDTVRLSTWKNTFFHHFTVVVSAPHTSSSDRTSLHQYTTHESIVFVNTLRSFDRLFTVLRHVTDSTNIRNFIRQKHIWFQLPHIVRQKNTYKNINYKNTKTTK